MTELARDPLRVASFRRAVAISAACERLRRAGHESKSLRRNAEASVLAKEAPDLDEAAAATWLRQHGCTEFLGAGTFGHVYRMRASTDAVVKWIPAFPSDSGVTGNAQREFEHQRLFAQAGLAWMPLGLINAAAARQERLSGVPRRALKRNVAGLVMPLLDATLDKMVKTKGPGVLTPDVGHRLVALLKAALEAGYAHNDLKANNVGLIGADLKMIDFGRALSTTWLVDLDLRDRWLAVEEATVADALRLAASLQHLMQERNHPVLQDLRGYAATLMRAPDAALDRDDDELLQLYSRRVRDRLRAASNCFLSLEK